MTMIKKFAVGLLICNTTIFIILLLLLATPKKVLTGGLLGLGFKIVRVTE